LASTIDARMESVVEAHGGAVAGANQGPVYMHHGAATWLKIKEPGTLHATAYCNLHGLWESSKDISLL